MTEIFMWGIFYWQPEMRLQEFKNYDHEEFHTLMVRFENAGLKLTCLL